MTNKLIYHKNYTEFGESYLLVLPLNLEGLVPDDFVRLLSHELEDLDCSLLYQAYSAKGRNPAVDPKTFVWKKSVGNGKKNVPENTQVPFHKNRRKIRRTGAYIKEKA